MFGFKIIKIYGEDADAFLQGLITNDINLAKKNTIYAMILTPNGRYLFDIFVSYIDDTYFLEIRSDRADSLSSKLRMYKLRKKVEIEVLEQLYVGYYNENNVQDNDLKKILHNLELIHIKHQYKDPRFSKLGQRIIFEQSKTDNSFYQELLTKISTMSHMAYTRDKYEYAIPDGDIDLKPEVSIPQEYGVEELNAINYTKGCYVGQELISRTKYQGVLRKKIFKIVSLKNSIDSVTQDIINLYGKKIGILCSANGNVGIALLRVEDTEGCEEIETKIGNFIIMKPLWL